MTRLFDFENQLFSYLENFRQQIQARPLNLGGVSGSGGGSGGPPGGFVGQLPQSRVAFDSTEASTMNIPSSGMSLIDNLNRIRYRLSQVENVVSGSILTVIEDNTTEFENIRRINFLNSIITGNGNQVDVYIPRSGGPSNYFFDLDDVPHSYLGHSGKLVVVKSGEDGLDFSENTFLLQVDTPNTYSGQANKIVKVNSQENGLEFTGLKLIDLIDTPNSYDNYKYLRSTSDGFVLSSISSTFIDLNDTPAFYSGHAGHTLIVNSTEDGLVFVPTGVIVTNFTSLFDTPNSYTGFGGYVVTVNTAENALEFSPVSSLGGGIDIYKESNIVGYDIDEISFVNFPEVSLGVDGRVYVFSNILNFSGYGNVYNNINNVQVVGGLSLLQPASGTVIISGGSSLSVKDNYNVFLPNTSSLNFVGFTLTQTDANEVTISGAQQSGGVGSFIELSDTPSSYTGQGLKPLRVNSSETGIEFFTIPTLSGYNNFIDLLDTPTSYSGAAKKFLVVNQYENAVEFSSDGIFTFWNPDAPPSNSHPKDDEFNDGVLASKWILFDPDSILYTVEETDVGLRVATSGVLNPPSRLFSIAGVFQSVPSSNEFTIWTKIDTASLRGIEQKFGLILAEDLNTSSNFQSVWVNNTVDNPCYLQLEDFDAYNSISSTETKIIGNIPNYIYLRLIKRADALYTIDYSLDGITWISVFNRSSFNYSYVGLGLRKTNQAYSPYYNFDFNNYVRFFRVVEHDNPNIVLSGNFSTFGSGGAETFIRLADTPDSYGGNELKFVRVKNDGNGLEFVSVSGFAKDNFIELLDTPSTYLSNANKIVAVKSDESGLQFIDMPTTPTSFLNLTDTPNSYTGNALNAIRVNAGANGLEFYSPFLALSVIADEVLKTNYAGTITLGSGLGYFYGGTTSDGRVIAGLYNKVLNFYDLLDTPANYNGQGGKVPVVKLDESGLEFVAISGLNGSSTYGTGSIYWYVDGNLGASTGVYTYVAPTNLIINTVKVTLGNFGTSGNTVIDINKNGTSILASPITIPYNYSSAVYEVSVDVSVNELDLLSLDIDSAAANSANLSVTLGALNGAWVNQGNLTGGLYWYVDGLLYPASGIASRISPLDLTLASVFVNLGDFGSNGSTEIDITKNGTSILSSPITIPYNYNQNVYTLSISESIQSGDILNIDINTVASGASNLAVSLEATISGFSYSGASTLLGLTDTPSSYSGNAGKVLAVKSTEDGTEFITVSGGTTSISYFSGDAVPSTSTGSISDEFETNTISDWIEFDPDGRASFSIQNGYLRGVLDYYGSHENRVSLLKQIPSGDFTIETHVYLSSEFIEFRSAGLVLHENTTNSGEIYTWELTLEDNMYDFIRAEADIFYDYQNINSVLAQLRMLNVLDAYLRISRSGSTYTYYYSNNGLSWIKVWSGSLSPAPTYFGLGMANRVGGGNEMVSYYEYFRYWNQAYDYSSDLIRRAKFVV